MIYKQYKPSAKLRHFIRYFWSYESHPQQIQPLHIKSFADKYPRLIFQCVDKHEGIRYGNGVLAPVCYLSGIDTIPSDAYWSSSFSHFGVSFFSHALALFFHIHASELTDAMPDITNFNGKKLVLQLQNANHQEKVTILSRFFEEKLQDMQLDPFIHQLVHMEDIQKEDLLNDLPGKYGVSERQIQRKVKEYIGIPLKKYQRIDKFEKALLLLNERNFENLSTLAHQLNYFDQSHFIRDFSFFSGSTPLVYCSKEKVGVESSSFIYPA